MNKTITVWQIDRGGSPDTLLVKSLSELETAYDFRDDIPQDFTISCLEMTQDEYDALDDFGGF